MGKPEVALTRLKTPNGVGGPQGPRRRGSSRGWYIWVGVDLLGILGPLGQSYLIKVLKKKYKTIFLKYPFEKVLKKEYTPWVLKTEI